MRLTADDIIIAKLMFLYAEDLGNPRLRGLASKFHKQGYLYDDEFKRLEKIFQKKAYQKIFKGVSFQKYDRGFHPKLRQYQREGVLFMESRNRVLLGDEMGLGKTAQVLSFLSRNKKTRPCIVICPASLKYNWGDEIKKWTGLSFFILEGTKPTSLPKVDVYILNYDILPPRKKIIREKGKRPRKEIIQGTGWEKELLRIGGKSLILDEAHNIKSPKTERTRACKRLAKKIPYMVAMTGTPLLNRPVEMQPILSALDFSTWGDRWFFVLRYCGAKKTRWGWDFKGASRIDELKERLYTSLLIRRRKKDVMSQLPEKSRCIVPVGLSNEKEYLKIRDDFFNWAVHNIGTKKARKMMRAKTLVQLGKLKKAAALGKLKSCCDWIDNYLDSGKKLVVFAEHIEILEILKNHFKKRSVLVYGKTPPKEKNKAVQAFQNNPKIKIFLGNIKAAGVGLTLTAAQDTCFLELPWTPGLLVQAEDRTHRIGQKQSVTAYYLIAHNTIERDIINILDNKMKTIAALLGDSEDSILSDELLIDTLLDSLLKGN